MPRGFVDRHLDKQRMEQAKYSAILSSLGQVYLVYIYNRYVYKFKQFCESQHVRFPSNCSATITELLSGIAHKSSRPKSQLKMASAALSCMLEATSMDNTVHSKDI